MVKNRESRASLPDSEMADESNAPATTNTTTDGSEHEANDDGDVSMDVCTLLPQIILLIVLWKRLCSAFYAIYR